MLALHTSLSTKPVSPLEVTQWEENLALSVKAIVQYSIVRK